MTPVRRIVTFDVPSGPIGPGDADEGLRALRALPGVQGVALWETRDGHAEYMLDVTVDAPAADQVERELDRQMRNYGEYLRNVVRRNYVRIG